MPETAALARDPRLPRHRGLYYGGAWHASTGGRAIAVIAPGDRRIARHRRSTRRPRTSIAPSPRRARRFRRGATRRRRNARRRSARPSAILREHADELAWLEALDTGNPFQAMRFDVEISADVHGLLRRSRHRDQGRHDPDRRRHAQLHAARAARRRRPHRRVQSSAALHRGQVRRAARRRQYADREAGRPDAAVVAAHRRALGRRVSRRACSTSSPADATRAPRWSRIPKVAKIGFIGSVAAGRAVMTGAARDAQGADARARRQERARSPAPTRRRPRSPTASCAGMNFRYVTGQSCNSTSRVYLHDANPRRDAGRDRQARGGAQGRAADRARHRESVASRARRSSTRR